MTCFDGFRFGDVSYRRSPAALRGAVGEALQGIAERCLSLRRVSSRRSALGGEKPIAAQGSEHTCGIGSARLTGKNQSKLSLAALGSRFPSLT